MTFFVRQVAFVLIFWAAAHSFLTAQITFSMPFQGNLSPASTVTVPVTTTGFNGMLGVQFVIAWDPQVLQFNNVQVAPTGSSVPYLPGLSSNDFNSDQSLTGGILRLAWTTTNLLTGNTVPDGSTLFQLQFQVIGPVNSGTDIVFTELPPLTLFEVVQALPNGGQVSYDLNNGVQVTNGGVAVGTMVAAEEPEGMDGASLSVAPNPFLSHARVNFFLSQPADVQLVVMDALGKIFLERNFFDAQPGQHGMEIASHDLTQKGHYFVVLRTGKQIFVRTLSRL